MTERRDDRDIRDRKTRWGRLAFAGLAMAAAIVAAAPGAWAEEPREANFLLESSLLEGGFVQPAGWRLGVGDDPAWAAADFDDSTWPVIERLVFRRGEPLPEGWQGVAWLRTELDVAEELVGQPLAISISQLGALEVFLDGEKVSAIGEIAVDASGRVDLAATVPAMRRAPGIVVFDRPGRHQMSLRYANGSVPSILKSTGSTGIRLHVSMAEPGISRALALSQFQNRSLGWFFGLFIAFGLLHLLLFLFYPSIRANLDFAALCFVLSGLVFFLIYRFLQDDPRFLGLSEAVLNQLGLLVGITSLRFVYGIFYDRNPRFFTFYLILAAPLAIWGLLAPDAALHFVYLYMLTATAEMMRVVAVAIYRGKSGALLVGAGVFSLALGFTIGLLANLGLLPRSPVTNFLVPFSSMGVLLVCMSIYLSRRFAAVHRDLAARLEEVERLSAEKLEKERQLRAEAIERGVLEERYEQKVRELEEARELQLSMLPKSLPAIPDLDIATHMQTATEVGGDYYDFELDDDTLIIAIGDATGHGMRAGTMVTAAKSLFNVLASDHGPMETLSRSTRAIKRMNFRKLAMALTLARYRDGELLLSAAGMPPAMIYRSASREVEQVLLGGMPLGAMASFPYREARVELLPGDVVLLMSDGFPERLNGDQELLGYERTAELFAKLARGSAADVVAGLRHEETKWAGEVPADDDVTFVVLKRSEGKGTHEKSS